MHLSICLTYILSHSIIFFYIKYNPVIVIGTMQLLYIVE